MINKNRGKPQTNIRTLNKSQPVAAKTGRTLLKSPVGIDPVTEKLSRIPMAAADVTADPTIKVIPAGGNTVIVETTKDVYVNTTEQITEQNYVTNCNILGGVTCLVAGCNISLSANTGCITVCSTGGGAVSSVTASGNGVAISPTTGAVRVCNTGVTCLVAGSGISLSAGAGCVTVCSTGGGGGSSLPYLQLTNTQVQNPFTGTPVNFIKENNGSQVDNIDTDVAITRGVNLGIYNPLFEVSWNSNISPVNTLWNADGWGDLSDVADREYTTFYNVNDQSLDYNVVGTEYIMKDTVNNQYYTVKFSHWTWNGNGGGGIQYERRLINQEVYFTKLNYGDQVDYIDTDVAITRGNNQGIYNPLVEVSWNVNVSPANTLWNADGWKDFTNFSVTDRIYSTFNVAVNGNLGENVPGAELIMYDTVNNKYYAIMFTQWTPYGLGGGFKYTRRLLNTPQAGITFADGTVQNTAFNMASIPSMPVKYNFLNYNETDSTPLAGQAVFDYNYASLRLNPIALNAINQFNYYDYIFANNYNAVVKVTSTVDPNVFGTYRVTNIETNGSQEYRGFRAGVNRIYESWDPNISQLIITQSVGAIPTYSSDGNTDNDDFTASGIDSLSNFLAFVNVYGSYINNPMPINSLLKFFKTFVDVVIYGGGGSVVSLSQMQEEFYNNMDVLEATLPAGSLDTDFRFFTNYFNYLGVPNSGGTGSGFTIDVTKKENGTYEITVTNAGTLYAAGDVITVLGTDLGGASPANDLTITVESVDVGGEILTVSLSGNPAYPTINWPTNFISDGGNDQYDSGNFLNTNLGTEISYNNGNIVSSAPELGGGDYFVAYKGSVFAMMGTGVSGVTSVFYSGGLGADESGLEQPRSLFMPENYQFYLQPLTQNGYMNFQWGTQWYVEIDLNGLNFANTSAATPTTLGTVYASTTSSTTNVFLGYCAGCAVTAGLNNTIIGAQAGTMSMSSTVLIGAGTCERIKVDNTGLYINGSLFSGGGVTCLIAGTGICLSDNTGCITVCSTGGGASPATPTVVGTVFACTPNCSGGSIYLGQNAGNSFTGGTSNIAIGACSLACNTSGNNNIAIGQNVLNRNVNGEQNIAMGSGAMYCNTGGGFNVALGSSAMAQNTTGLYNIGIGALALYGAANAAGFNNIALGHQAMRFVTTGSANIALGPSSLLNNSSGCGNIALGNSAGFGNTCGRNNIAIGTVAIQQSVTGNDNIAIGACSMGVATGVDQNVMIGTCSGRLLIGCFNVGVGDQAGSSTVTGRFNTFVGGCAGASLTSGYNNTFIGYGAQPSASNVDNTITLGNVAVTCIRAAVTTISAISDARDKTDVQPIPLGLEFIMSLRPVKFTWNMRTGEKVGVLDSGFIAQDIAASQDQFNARDWLDMVGYSNPDKLEIKPAKLVPILVKAIQDLKHELNELKAVVDALKG